MKNESKNRLLQMQTRDQRGRMKMKDVYISKYDAVKTVEKECKAFCPTKLCKLTEYIENAIEEAPEADVQPVKHGKWIDHKKFERKNCNVCIECSVCNTWFGHDCIPKTKFCPNCGARMDGDSE